MNWRTTFALASVLGIFGCPAEVFSADTVKGSDKKSKHFPGRGIDIARVDGETVSARSNKNLKAKSPAKETRASGDYVITSVQHTAQARKPRAQTRGLAPGSGKPTAAKPALQPKWFLDSSEEVKKSRVQPAIKRAKAKSSDATARPD